MDDLPPVTKAWFIRIAPAEAQVRCAFQRVKNRIVQFTVQLEEVSGEIPRTGRNMIDSPVFSQKQFELAAEFGKFVVEHPAVAEDLPEGAFVYFEITGEAEFNRYSRELAEQQRREEGVPVVLVRVKGLAPPQGSRLIEPVIQPATTFV